MLKLEKICQEKNEKEHASEHLYSQKVFNPFSWKLVIDILRRISKFSFVKVFLAESI